MPFRSVPLRGTSAALVLLLLGAAGDWAPAAGQTPPNEPADSLPLDPAVRTGTLDNGLTYYVRANARPEKRAELRLVVNAGSVLETEQQRGLAHFVEHMAFNGTLSFPKSELVGYLESIGMRFGADLNAYTGFDETVYQLTVPTDTGTFLERGIQILEEWAHAVTLDAEEIEKERGVVIEEWRLGQGAGARMRDRMLPVLLHGSRYAERLPIGDRAVLESFEPEQARAFYRDWYRPELMAVVAVGDFDAARVEAVIRERFAQVPRGEGPERTEYPVPDHDETLAAIVTDPEATGSSVTVYYKLPSSERGTVAGFRSTLVDQLHGAMLNARLSELSQRADPPFLGAGSSKGGLLRTRDAYLIGAGVADGGIERGLDAVLTEAERVARHGFTETELDRARTDLLRAYEQAHAERDKTNSATYAQQYASHFLDGEAVPGIEAEYELAQRILPGISLEAVNALSARWMATPSRVIIAQAPEKEGLDPPTEQQLLAVFDAVRGRDIEPYTDIVADAPLLAEPPAPGAIAEERQHADAGVTEWRLSNGARVLLKPTDFKDDEVLFGATSPGGTSLAPDEDLVSASLATMLVGASGLGEFDLVQLRKVLTGKAADVDPSIAELSEGFSGQASPQDLETLFQLVHLYFTAPRRDEEAFQSLRTRLHASLVNQNASPQRAFSDTIQVTLAQHHPRARPFTTERLESWDLEESLEFYRDRFADAGDFTFAFAGSFDLERIRPLVEQYLASLPSAGRRESWRDNGVRPPEDVVEKVVRRGLEPRSETALIFTGSFEDSRANRHLLASVADALEMRLRDVLREELGGTYGARVSQSGSRDPYPRYSFTISFGAAPERVDELAAEVFRQIEALQRDGPDAETLARMRETQRRSYETSLEQNGFWLSQLLHAARVEEPPGAFLAYPSLVESLTAEAVRDAAARYLDRERYVRVTLVPQGG